MIHALWRLSFKPIRALTSLSWLTLALVGINSGMNPAQAQSTAPEVIVGQSRHLSPEKTPPTPETASFFPNALTPVPTQSYPRKSKRARKHRLDSDRDGFVSRSEFELEHHARFNAFRAADTNQDGKLDAEEMRQFRKLTTSKGSRH